MVSQKAYFRIFFKKILIYFMFFGFILLHFKVKKLTKTEENPKKSFFAKKPSFWQSSVLPF